MSEPLSDLTPGVPTPSPDQTADRPPPDDHVPGEDDGLDLAGLASAATPATDPSAPRLDSPRRGRRLVHKGDQKALALTPQQRLLLLDTWQRSGLPAGDFAALVGLSKYTLYQWKQRFDREG